MQTGEMDFEIDTSKSDRRAKPHRFASPAKTNNDWRFEHFYSGSLCHRRHAPEQRCRRQCDVSVTPLSIRTPSSA
jgi:hypothetical protein